MGNQQDLFTGAASFYKHRSPYPRALFEAVAAHFGLDGTSRLLDLGCGPGNVFLGLQAYFEQVVALDINREMLAEARVNAAHLEHVRFVEQSAEILPADLGMFRLATFGRSFHWMEREKVLLQVWERLESGGGIAIIDSDYHRPWWEHVTTGLILRWRLRDRAVQPKTDSPSERHEAVVEHSRFSQITKGEIKEMESVGIEQILGRIYSTSSGKPELFGENLANFEHDVRQVLGMLEPSGTFVRDRRFSYILARKS